MTDRETIQETLRAQVGFGCRVLSDSDLSGLVEAMDAVLQRGNGFDGADLAAVAWQYRGDRRRGS